MSDWLLAVPPFTWPLLFLAAVTAILIGGFVLVDRQRGSTDLDPTHVVPAPADPVHEARHSTEGQTRRIVPRMRPPTD